MEPRDNFALFSPLPLAITEFFNVGKMFWDVCMTEFLNIK